MYDFMMIIIKIKSISSHFTHLNFKRFPAQHSQALVKPHQCKICPVVPTQSLNDQVLNAIFQEGTFFNMHVVPTLIFFRPYTRDFYCHSARAGKATVMQNNRYVICVLYICSIVDPHM